MGIHRIEDDGVIDSRNPSRSSFFEKEALHLESFSGFGRAEESDLNGLDAFAFLSVKPDSIVRLMNGEARGRDEEFSPNPREGEQ